MSNTYTTTYTTVTKVDETAVEEIVTNAYVDRIEKVEKGTDKAVMYFGDDDEKVVMPVSMLPKGVKPDDSLIIKISLDVE